ncbi:unnamed protein product [Heterobilharzia americana]|nr:unnamed protein product [Heterobilharzia americana]
MDLGAKNPRRSSSVKESRLALLAKLREAKEKGERLRIEKDEQPVYETVDESEYAELVRKRLEDDWIVDDEGGEYAEDGREIFDDNDEDEETSEVRNKKNSKVSCQSASKKKRLNPDIRPSESTSLRPSVGRDIRSLFAASCGSNSSKKRKEAKDLSVDPNLDDLLAELESSVTEPEPRHRSDFGSKRSLMTPKPKSGISCSVASAPISLKRRSPERSEQSYNTFSGHHPQKPLLSEDDKSSRTQPTPRPLNPFSCRKPTETDQKAGLAKTQVTERSEKYTSRSAKDIKSLVPEVDVDFSEDFELEAAQLGQTQPSVFETKSTAEPVIQPNPGVAASWLAAESLAKTDDANWIDEADPLSFPPSSKKGNILYFYWFDAYEDSRQLPVLDTYSQRFGGAWQTCSRYPSQSLADGSRNHQVSLAEFDNSIASGPPPLSNDGNCGVLISWNFS